VESQNRTTIRICPAPERRIAVYLPYTEDRVARIRTISGHDWNPQQGCWTVPRTARAVTRLLELFSGNEVELDPSLRLPKPKHPGQRPAFQVAPGPAGDTLQAVLDALANRAYSRQTIKIYATHIKRLFIRIKKHPRDIRARDIRIYLQDMINRERVSELYLNQAISAISFLFKNVLAEPDVAREALRIRRSITEGG